MIHNALGSVIQSNAEMLSLNSHLVQELFRMNDHILDTRPHPRCNRRPHRPRPPPVLDAARQPAEQIRPLDDQADAYWTYAAPAIEHPREPLRAHPLVASKPVYIGIANQDFHMSPRFV